MNSWRVSTLVRKTPKHRRRGYPGVLFFHPAHPHAQVLGLQHHGDTQWVELFHQRGRDLGRHALLDLKPARVDFDQPRKFGQTDDVMAGQIGDMCLAHEGQQVMFAQGIEVNVPADDYLLVILFDEQRAVDHRLGVLRVAAGEELVGLDHPGWCALQTFPFGILADMPDQATNRAFR